MSQRPSFQFYPRDWLTDAALRACSLEARALWIDLLCLMNDGNPYGYLTLPNGKKVEDKDLINRFNMHHKTLYKLLKELEYNVVLKRDTNGVIYSKRMVEDEAKRSSWRERQQKHRAGGQVENEPKNERDVTPLSRTSHAVLHSSSSSAKKYPPTPKGESSGFEKFWNLYPKKKAKSKSEAIWNRKKLDLQADRIIGAVERYRQSSEWLKDDGQFIPYPSTFLNGERWEDEISAGTSKPKAKTERVFESWQNGKRLKWLYSAQIFRPEQLEPWDSIRNRGAPETPNAFRMPDGQTGELMHFIEIGEQ